MSERETRDAARSLSVVHYMDRDLQAAATLAAGLVERSGAGEGKPSFLAVLPTDDDTLAFTEAVLSERPEASHTVTPLTSLARGRRIIASGAMAVAATPAHIARLLSESRLDLSRLHTVLVVWPEEILRDDEQREFLERVVAEIPRSVERVACCGGRSSELAQFLERSMWRAREIDHTVPAPARADAPLRVMVVPSSERARAIRSLLDAFDPESAVLLAFSDGGERMAQRLAALFGPSVEAARGVPERGYPLGIVVDDLPSAEVLTAATAAVGELVAVVLPSRVAALHKVAANVTPMTWSGALANARLTLDALRDEIRGYVASGGHATWIPVIEPLLDGLDAVEVAAASLGLLDRERRKAKRAAQATVVPTPVERPVRDERPAHRPRREDDRARPDRGFPKKRPFGEDRRNAGAARGPRRETADRPPRESRGGRRDDIERVPRAAREGREWSERGERLRNSRRGPRGRDAG